LQGDISWGLMSAEATALAAEMTPYISAAIGAYGGAVLARVRDSAADATVGLGRQLLQRIFGYRSARNRCQSRWPT